MLGCTDTLSATHVNQCAVTPGAAASSAEERKRVKYSRLEERFRFEPIAVETFGTFGPSTACLVQEIGRKIYQTTGDPSSQSP